VKLALAGLALLLALAGCKSGSRLAPLDKGHEWTYKVQTPLYSYVETVRVGESVPVGPISGVELTGPMGRSCVGWRGSRLEASALGTTQYEPPIPLVDASMSKATWKGKVISAGKAVDATATLEHKRETLRLPSRQFETVRSTLKVTGLGIDMELISWFANGVGVVRQEQRNDGDLAVRMEWIRGPGLSK